MTTTTTTTTTTRMDTAPEDQPPQQHVEVVAQASAACASVDGEGAQSAVSQLELLEKGKEPAKTESGTPPLPTTQVYAPAPVPCPPVQTYYSFGPASSVPTFWTAQQHQPCQVRSDPVISDSESNLGMQSTGHDFEQAVDWMDGQRPFYFNPAAAGYNQESAGQDPRHGYPFVYPYVPLRMKERGTKLLRKKKKLGCC